VAYEVVGTPLGGSSQRNFAAEVLAGARYAGVDIEVDRFTGGGGQLSADGQKDWIDPFVDLRARFDITDNLYTFARGDVGGFGVGSDFVWNANVGVGFEITDNFDIAAGYRWLDYDFEDGDFTFDVQIAGPWIALLLKL
jgi:opacity protein-like surface antigen